jgi:hypothetical protein
MATILLSDIPDESLRVISEQIFRFTSPLLKLYYDPPGVETVDVLGAGTFVKIEETFGLLTAHHVASGLAEAPALGLVLLEEEDNFHLQQGAFEIIEIATPIDGEIGPDLAFIRLPKESCSRIIGYKDFYSLTENRDELLNNAPPIDHGIWSICGPPKENIRLEDSSKTFDHAITMQLFCGFGGVEIEDSVRGYDYFRMSTEYVPSNGVPRGTKGMSGGGLWQIPITIYPDNRVMARRFLLSGVNFWRSVDSNGKKYAKSHGRTSLYDKAYNTVLERCA